MLFEISEANSNAVELVEVNNLLDLLEIQNKARERDVDTRENFFKDCALIIDVRNQKIEIYNSYIE